MKIKIRNMRDEHIINLELKKNMKIIQVLNFIDCVIVWADFINDIFVITLKNSFTYDKIKNKIIGVDKK